MSTEKKIIKAELPSDVAQEYELVDWTGSHRQFFGRFGTIDVTKLTTKKCARLIAGGFKKIRKITKAAAKTTETPNSSKK